MIRPDWNNYFLGIAKVVAQRSHDQHTKHGCVITDAEHRILGVGKYPAGVSGSGIASAL